MKPGMSPERHTMESARLKKRESALFALLLVFFGVKSYFLIYRDLNMFYPFLVPDSYSWIANGLHYEGYKYVNFSPIRNPGLPLLIAALDKMDVLNMLPAVNQFVLLGLLVVAYKHIKKEFGVPISIFTGLLLFVNYFLENASLFILADIYAIFFILLGYYFYVEARTDPAKYMRAFLFMAVSALFSNGLVFFLPAVVIHFLLFRRNIGIKKIPMVFLPPFLVPLGWFFIRRTIMGADAYGYQLSLVRPHISSVFFYLSNTASVLGLALFVLFLAGLARALILAARKRAAAGVYDLIRLNALIILFWCIFWVTLYDWNDRRFVIYLMFFTLPFIAISLEYLSGLFYRRGVIGKAAVASLLGLAVYQSGLSYGSPWEATWIKLAGAYGIRFDSTCDSTCDMNIRAAGFRMMGNDDADNSVNPLYLWQKKEYRNDVGLNDDPMDADSRKRLERYIPYGICVIYDQPVDGAAWYIDMNRYGNYFKTRLRVYPNGVRVHGVLYAKDSDRPVLEIRDNRLYLIPGL